MIVVGSNGDEEKSRIELEKVIGTKGQIAIINNQIEDWLPINKNNFSKLRLIQSIDELIMQIDFDKLQSEDKAFNTIIEFMHSNLI